MGDNFRAGDGTVIVTNAVPDADARTYSVLFLRIENIDPSHLDSSMTAFAICNA